MKKLSLIVVVSVLFLASCGGETTSCTEGDIRVTEETCQVNGYYRDICENGEWVEFDCLVECTDGETKEGSTECGLNNNGNLEQECKNKVWTDTEKCIDPDECVNDDTQELSCGLNDRGQLTSTCENGKWGKGTCTDPDECEDGDKDADGDPCGEVVDGKQIGKYELECVEGKWKEGDCIVSGYESETCDIGKIECRQGVAYINNRVFEDCQDCWDTTPANTNCVLSEPSYTCGGCRITCQ